MRLNVRLVALLVVTYLSRVSRADVVVRFDPPTSIVSVGDTVHIDLVADFPEPVLGWGLDLDNSNTFVAALASLPTISAPWTAAFTADGDGLGAVAFPTPVSGSGVVLAELTFHAAEVGISQLSMHATSGDFTEGFARYPSGFLQFTSEVGIIEVIPEPATAILIALGLASLTRRQPVP